MKPMIFQQDHHLVGGGLQAVKEQARGGRRREAQQIYVHFWGQLKDRGVPCLAVVFVFQTWVLVQRFKSQGDNRCFSRVISPGN